MTFGSEYIYSLGWLQHLDNLNWLILRSAFDYLQLAILLYLRTLTICLRNKQEIWNPESIDLSSPFFFFALGIWLGFLRERISFLKFLENLFKIQDIFMN